MVETSDGLRLSGLDLENESLNRNDFFLRVKNRREKLGLKQVDLAQKIDVSTNTIQSWEKSTWPRGDDLMRLAEHLHCTVEWLLYGRGLQSNNQKEVDLRKFESVPVAENHLNAGGGNVVLSENFNQMYMFKRSWIKRIATSTNNLILMFIDGNSMEPTLQSGDLVMLDMGRTKIKSGAIFAIGVDDSIMIKRLELLIGGRVRVLSENEEYKPYQVDAKELRIIGQLVWSAHEHIRLD